MKGLYAVYCDGALGVPMAGLTIHSDELDGVGLVIVVGLGEGQAGASAGASAAPRISSGEYG